MAGERSYSEKLKDPRWQRRRLEIFNRDDFTCQLCGSKHSTLAVHHRYYEPRREPWEYPDEALLTLCEPCHDSEYQAREYEMLLLQNLKRCGAMGDQFLWLSGLFDPENPLGPDIWPHNLSADQWTSLLRQLGGVIAKAFGGK